jgi:nucleotide-binding universal stress UspA family protein
MEGVMDSQPKLSRMPISRILLATDFSPEPQNALQYAVSLTRRSDSTLFLTHVLPTERSAALGEMWPVLSNIARHNAEKNMTKLQNMDGLKFLPHEVVIRAGDTWDVISRVVSDKNVDLIVVGNQGHRGITKLFLGSTAERVIRHANCPVLTVGPHVPSLCLNRFRHILCASDFCIGSRRALNFALSLAADDRARLILLHVVESDPGSPSELLEWKRQDLEKLRQMVPPDADLACEPEIEVEIGIAEAEILRLAASRKTDLIVMGCHFGGPASTHLPWTTLHHVLQHAPCPVLTVRGERPELNGIDDSQSSRDWFSE